MLVLRKYEQALSSWKTLQGKARLLKDDPSPHYDTAPAFCFHPTNLS